MLDPKNIRTNQEQYEAFELRTLKRVIPMFQYDYRDGNMSLYSTAKRTLQAWQEVYKELIAQYGQDSIEVAVYFYRFEPFLGYNCPDCGRPYNENTGHMLFKPFTVRETGIVVKGQRIGAFRQRIVCGDCSMKFTDAEKKYYSPEWHLAGTLRRHNE